MAIHLNSSWIAATGCAGLAMTIRGPRVRLERVFKMIVIARRAERAVAIQLDCFVAAQSAAPRNDRI